MFVGAIPAAMLSRVRIAALVAATNSASICAAGDRMLMVIRI
jgi:hypothetical protein